MIIYSNITALYISESLCDNVTRIMYIAVYNNNYMVCESVRTHIDDLRYDEMSVYISVVGVVRECWWGATCRQLSMLSTHSIHRSLASYTIQL